MKLSASTNLQYLGKLKTRRSTEIGSSRLGVGFECLDREMWDPNFAWPVLEELGVKWARVQTGWARTEKTAGTYDFDWLDQIVNSLLERGVQPWLSLSYGNPIYTKQRKTHNGYDSKETLTCDAHGVGFPPIHSKEERQAWQNYTRALVRHFRDRVTRYEVWNEPDLLSFWKSGPRASEYVDLVRLVAGPLREEQPAAKLIGGAIAWGMTVWSLKYLEDCFSEGLHELIDIITYHGYKSIPERHSTQEISAFRHLINRYKPELEYWQGEAGIQSKVSDSARGKAALSTMQCNEPIQARMLLRRALLELHNGCSMTSYFHMSDFAHYSTYANDTFHYGLIRLEDGSRKPSYYALQTLCTLFGDTMEPANGRSACHMSVLEDSEDPRATKVFTWHANFICGDVPVHAWWLPESLEDDPAYREAEMTLWLENGLKLENPVLIEPVSQEVYAIDYDYDKRTCAESWMNSDPDAEGVFRIKSLPVGIDPLFITDRSLIQVV